MGTALHVRRTLVNFVIGTKIITLYCHVLKATWQQVKTEDGVVGGMTAMGGIKKMK